LSEAYAAQKRLPCRARCYIIHWWCRHNERHQKKRRILHTAKYFRHRETSGFGTDFMLQYFNRAACSPPSPPKPTVATSKRRLSNKRDAAGAARKKRVNAKSYRLTPAQKNKELIAKKKKYEAFSKAFKECTAAAAEVKGGKQLRDIISTAAQKAGLSPSAAPKERRRVLCLTVLGRLRAMRC